MFNKPSSFLPRYACLLLLSGPALLAQVATTSGAPAKKPQAPKHEIDLAMTYSGFRQNGTPGPSFWQNGGSADFSAQIHRGLGAEALFTGATAHNANGSGVDVNTIDIAFGPRYTWTHSGVAVFGDALFGEAHGFHGVYPSSSGAMPGASSLAVMAGGGMDIHITPHIAYRPIEVRWLRTQLPNATTNVQNGFEIGTGIVFRFKSK